MQYTPLFNPRVSFHKDDIDKQFLVNRKLLDVVMRGIVSEGENSIPQPRIIIGVKGTGKSWIMMAIRDLLEEEGRDFVPYYFDASEINTLTELDTVIASRDKKGGRLVLLADNTDRLFSMLSEQDQYVLRGRLNTNGAPILICSASSTPKALTDYSSAFFDGFDVQYIDKSSIEKACDILGLKTDSQRSRATTLLEIVGTEIRNIMLVRNILSMSTSVEKDRQILYDYLHEAITKDISSLPWISQQIVAQLALTQKGETLAGLRERMGMESSKLSPYISLLLTQGILTKQEESIRKSRYNLMDNRLRFVLTYT